MQKHTKIYFEFFGIDMGTYFVPCEICGKKATEIHHIQCRGMGGSKSKDNIENLMALDRECHEKYGDKKQYLKYLQNIHKKQMKNEKSKTML